MVKSIYGLRQAPRQWNKKLSDFLLKLGFKQSLDDYALFVHQDGTNFTVAVVYVDDILSTGNHTTFIVDIKAVLRSKFSIKNLGQAKYYLGLEISRNDLGLVLSQQKFILDMLSSSNLLDSKPLSIPLDRNIKLFDNVTFRALITNPSVYRSLVGKMLYLTFTRPDINYSVHLLSQFLHAPRQKHFDTLIRVLRYLK